MSTFNIETGRGGEPVTVDTPYSKARALWVGGSGDVHVRFADGGDAIYSGVSGLLPVESVEVIGAGTTATLITTIR